MDDGRLHEIEARASEIRQIVMRKFVPGTFDEHKYRKPQELELADDVIELATRVRDLEAALRDLADAALQPATHEGVVRMAKAMNEARTVLSAASAREREREEMVCDRCGRHHGVVWFAPSDVWNAAMREGDRGNPDEYSFCCPICFIQLANARGITNTGWLVIPDQGQFPGPIDHASQIVMAAVSSPGRSER